MIPSKILRGQMLPTIFVPETQFKSQLKLTFSFIFTHNYIPILKHSEETIQITGTLFFSSLKWEIKFFRWYGLTGCVRFGSNTSDRIEGTGTYYVIDNTQKAANSLKVVEVLRLNGTALDVTRNSTTEWTTSGKLIRWPRNT